MVMPLFPLQVEQAQTSRRGKILVGPISITFEAQGTTVIVGPNGAGKTSFLKLLNGAARLTGGTVEWSCSEEDARKQQAFVFQKPVMLRRSVLANLIYPLRVRGMSRVDAEGKAREWANRVGLGDMLDRQAPALSGGEQQKLAIARALIGDPALVFLDEPSAALDGVSTREIEAILGTARKRGTRLILATHDMGQARRMADEVLFLHKGRLHEHGLAADFFARPETAEAQAFLRGDIVE
jgi:tungstate transport system ATP-binding protein